MTEADEQQFEDGTMLVAGLGLMFIVPAVLIAAIWFDVWRVFATTAVVEVVLLMLAFPAYEAQKERERRNKLKAHEENFKARLVEYGEAAKRRDRSEVVADMMRARGQEPAN